MAIFTDKDCVEINANNTHCECLTGLHYYFIQCPAKVAVPQIKIIINYMVDVKVKIEYNDFDSNSYKLLPAMDIGIVDTLHLSHYQLSNEPIANLMNHLGITTLYGIGSTLSDHLNVSITREHLSGLTNLEKLAVYNLDLSHASEDMFVDLPNLTWLSLSSANIQFKPNVLGLEGNFTSLESHSRILEQLPAGIFRNQYKLETLYIFSSQLQNVSKELFQNTTSLAILSLTNNTIESIQFDVFSSLTNLREIYLNENYLQELPAKIFSCNQKLTKVFIRDNHAPIKSLPSRIFANLRKLIFVYISYGTEIDNRFEDVSEAGKKTVLLSCGLTDIPSDFFANSVAFNDISLANNDLKTVDENLFADQFHLTYLDLSHNKLQSLPDGLFSDSVYLYDLYLSYNQLAEISSGIFSPLSRLRVLYIDNNHLTTISPDAFVQTTSLFYIYMQNNLLTLVDPFNSQKDNLKNKLNSPFQFLVSLHTLNLRNNSLSNMFSDWHKMEQLAELDLSYNNITSLNSSDLLFHSNNELNINLNHNQLSKINFQNITTVTDSLNKTISLQLNNNPLDCDCNLLPFLQFVRELSHDKLNLIVDELICQKPENIKDVSVRNVDGKAIHCPFDFKNFEPQHCPHNCTCWKRASVLVVNCSSAKMTEVSPLPLVQTLELKSIELHIENNALCKLPTVSTTGFADVTEIYAAGNNLSQIDVNNLPQNLTYLDLSRNKFTELNDKVINFFNQSTLPRKIALSENPWHCDCKSKPLLAFVTNSHNSNTTISDEKNVYCTTPINYKMTDYLLYKDICQEEQFVTNAFLGTITFVGFSIGLIIALLYYKFQTEIKVWLYKYRICSCCVNEEELDKDKTYDAFISYSHKDEDFIAEHLVPQLEEGPIRFKLCVHVRDFVIGECIPDQIVRAIDNSKRTIIVLSENFINSAWAQLEFRQAHQAGLNEGRARLIVILYGKIGDVKTLDKDLQAYLSTTTYLEWGNPWFWDKLRYAMPHPSRKLNNLVQDPLRSNVDDNMELNEIPIE